jgi:3-methyl-2-oxobutanoate hydroxymethyltransferase
MTYLAPVRSLTFHDLGRMRAGAEKIAMLTAYEASLAALAAEAGVDILLVGDSAGNVIQGHSSTLPVTLEQMVYHTACVSRGQGRALVVADLPFGSYQESREQALRSAAALMAAGAQCVKLEGGAPMVETVRFLVERGIPVCGHIGLTPQSVHQMGGYRVQGRGDSAATRLTADARALEDAGAALLVLEMVPAALARAVTAATSACATIGIGAGPDCHGQVLVMHDMLGITRGKKPRFVKDFLQTSGSIEQALRDYVAAVKGGLFPDASHYYE